MLILEYLQATPVAFIGFAVVLGLIVGSFLNVVIYRLPVIMERDWHVQCHELLELETPAPPAEPFNLAVPRSRCPDCGHRISAWENIPVLSWVALKGRCSECKNAISARYPCIELITGLATGVVASQFGVGEQAVAGIVLTWALIALAMIDYDHQLLPDSITLPFLWLGLGVNLFDVFASPEDALIGAMAGYGILWCVFQAYRLVTGKDGMGFGDFKLLALLGAWFGWVLLPFVIFLASVLGAAVGIALIRLRAHDRRVPIPFGPYLAIAGWTAMLWGADIMAWYLA
jgi:leader peptidase (prepilin peptidase)/N-methyltransferase